MVEKAETDTGWLFPVGDEVAELGYTDMFADMFNAWDEGREPMETLYDGYVVNAILDACHKSAKTKVWEPVDLEWRGGEVNVEASSANADLLYVILKTERLPDGRVKQVVKDKTTGEISERIEN